MPKVYPWSPLLSHVGFAPSVLDQTPGIMASAPKRARLDSEINEVRAAAGLSPGLSSSVGGSSFVFFAACVFFQIGGWKGAFLLRVSPPRDGRVLGTAVEQSKFQQWPPGYVTTRRLTRDPGWVTEHRGHPHRGCAAASPARVPRRGDPPLPQGAGLRRLCPPGRAGEAQPAPRPLRARLSYHRCAPSERRFPHRVSLLNRRPNGAERAGEHR